MAIYLVRARPKRSKLGALKDELERGSIEALEPFGRALARSLRGARIDSDGVALWEEVDYCQPPLKQERAAVLDRYFDDVEVEPVEQGAGWAQVQELPSLWTAVEPKYGDA